MGILCFSGTVFSGKGEEAKFVGLPWVKEQIIEDVGFSPYIGTLNIRLAKSDALKLKRSLKKAKAIGISSKSGFSSGKFYRGSLTDDIECAVIIPNIVGYPEDVLEVIAPLNLRDRFHLKDGDTLNVGIHV